MGIVTCFADFFQISYMFDEPSSYLDVRQRLRAAGTIRELAGIDKYSVWLSPYVCFCFITACFV